MHERWEDVRADFDERMREACTIAMLESARRQIERLGGAFLELGTPAVTVRGGYTVVDVPMAFESDEVNGRVAFNADEQVAGFFVLPAESR